METTSQTNQKNFKHAPALRTIMKQQSEVLRQQVVGYITTAFGLIAGLAWNDAVQSLIAVYWPNRNSLFAKFGYAIVITIIVVSFTFQLKKIFRTQ